MKKKNNPTKKIPTFKNEAEERAFWHTHDSTDYIDYSASNRADLELDPGLEAPVKLISIRLPREMLNRLKAMATKRDVPYQSLIKILLAKSLDDEDDEAA